MSLLGITFEQLRTRTGRGGVGGISNKAKYGCTHVYTCMISITGVADGIGMEVIHEYSMHHGH